MLYWLSEACIGPVLLCIQFKRYVRRDTVVKAELMGIATVGQALRRSRRRLLSLACYEPRRYPQ